MRILLAAILMLVACAAAPQPPADAARKLTADQDAAFAEMRDQCDSVGGCAVVPVPLFQKLMQGLKACIAQSRGEDL